jgi:prepilin-type N-terminal cleavage/methylation domain-containing protein
MKRFSGFTLAELLIALAILGVVSTFTIPKILASQQSSKQNAQAKEAAAMISGAFQVAKQNGLINANSLPSDLTPYMNYVAMVSDGTIIDSIPSGSTTTCNSSNPCIRLHNGGMLWFQNWYMGGPGSMYAYEMVFDTDPANNTTDTADGPLKAVQFTQYYDGFITTRGNVKPNTCNVFGCSNQPSSSMDPSWLKW